MKNKLKSTIYSLGCLLCLTITVFTSNAQSISSVESSSSCDQGGEIWACGRTEAVRAFDQFNANCTETDYPCGGKLLKTIRDLCTPGGLVLKITSKPCG